MDSCSVSAPVAADSLPEQTADGDRHQQMSRPEQMVSGRPSSDVPAVKDDCSSRVDSEADLDEDQPRVPGWLIEQRELPSRGSALHRVGQCKRCCFHGKGRCTNGYECHFCHFPHGKKKRTRGEKRSSKDSPRSERLGADPASVAGDTVESDDDDLDGADGAAEGQLQPEQNGESAAARKPEQSVVDNTTSSKPVRSDTPSFSFLSAEPSGSNEFPEEVFPQDAPPKMRCPPVQKPGKKASAKPAHETALMQQQTRHIQEMTNLRRTMEQKQLPMYERATLVENMQQRQEQEKTRLLRQYGLPGYGDVTKSLQQQQAQPQPVQPPPVQPQPVQPQAVQPQPVHQQPAHQQQVHKQLPVSRPAQPPVFVPGAAAHNFIPGAAAHNPWQGPGHAAWMPPDVVPPHAAPAMGKQSRYGNGVFTGWQQMYHQERFGDGQDVGPPIGGPGTMSVMHLIGEGSVHNEPQRPPSPTSVLLSCKPAQDLASRCYAGGSRDAIALAGHIDMPPPPRPPTPPSPTQVLLSGGLSVRRPQPQAQRAPQAQLPSQKRQPRASLASDDTLAAAPIRPADANLVKVLLSESPPPAQQQASPGEEEASPAAIGSAAAWLGDFDSSQPGVDH
eukprot:TRINITY_DN35383_c0_g1_i1.p1 TRINITY_DN35383_c0_g1~~TRINITY_DN35383_c0_g1_i1.p1  ORF type:complete len:671 (+),score=108.64 TRINITY_DN35383_c0_g1_i1:166-2013(+)